MQTLIKQLIFAYLITPCVLLAASTDLPQPFVVGSMQQITQVHRGKFLIVNVWSTDCGYCQEELDTLAKFIKSHPRVVLSLVSADPPQNTALVKEILMKHHFKPEQTWQFADEYAERLRFDIDRKWQGELPRTYLIDENGKISAISGRLSLAQLEKWLGNKKK